MKVLMCKSPNDNLTRIKDFNELALGTSWIVGGLKHNPNIDSVDYFDLDVYLRGKKESLSKYDLEILSDLDSLINYLDNPDVNTTIYKWVEDCCSFIPKNNYNVIGLSLIKSDVAEKRIISTLFFGIILAEKLISKFKCDLYIGGNYILKAYESIINEITKRHKNKLRHFYYDTLSIVSFPCYITKTKDERYTTQIKILSDFRIKNNGIHYGPKDIFSKEIINKYPTLLNSPKITLIPFKFVIDCKFNCSFCNASGKEFKMLKVEEAVDMIEKLIENSGSTNFRFFNSNINTSSKYVINFCNEIIKRNIKIKFSDSANFRPKTSTSEIFYALKDAGCIKLWFGSETFSNKMLKIIRKNITSDDILNGLYNSTKAGIWSCLNFIVNLPGETNDDFMETYNFISKNIETIDCYHGNVFNITPNSDIHIHPEKYGIEITEGFKYTENGQDWNSICERGNRRVNKLIDINFHKSNGIWKYDYPLFSMSQVIDDKELKKEIFKDIELEGYKPMYTERLSHE